MLIACQFQEWNQHYPNSKNVTLTSVLCQIPRCCCNSIVGVKEGTLTECWMLNYFESVNLTPESVEPYKPWKSVEINSVGVNSTLDFLLCWGLGHSEREKYFRFVLLLGPNLVMGLLQMPSSILLTSTRH